MIVDEKNIAIDPSLLAQLDRSVPRYTSYPTAPQFYPLNETSFLERIDPLLEEKDPLSLYLHIPFCKSMCLFCACSVTLNRDPFKQSRYVDYLLREIALLGEKFQGKKRVTQIHFGGGTPTQLLEQELEALLEKIQSSFIVSLDAEISIEVDPRTVFLDQGRKLRFLRKIGFNRVSFGVQDLDPKVQEAVKRRQSEEMTVMTYELAKELKFDSVNIDLIYGLPLQTVKSFQQTIDRLVQLKPDRIALFSYAKVPWLKPHQKAIDEKLLPTVDQKFQIYVDARKRLIEEGYLGIGMDHFARKEDPIAKAYLEKRLTRNFQGYSLELAEDLIGLGVTSIGFFRDAFFQNVKEISSYEKMIEEKKFPIVKGFILTKEDQKRRFVIQSLMCHFEVDKKEFEKKFQSSFDEEFQHLEAPLKKLEEEGLLERSMDSIRPTFLGSLFIRIIASTFDAYLETGRYSKSI